MQVSESTAALMKQGYDPHFLGPDQFAAYIASEKACWSAVASAAGLSSKG
jgi:tripartite-type tricarboxylate transporter receptor subunit TctC